MTYNKELFPTPFPCLRIMFLAALCLLVSATAACTSSDTLTVEEYGDALCDSDIRALKLMGSPYDTWGEFGRDTQSVIRELESIPPPPELERFHSANLTIWRNLLTLIWQKDPNAITTDSELLDIMSQMSAWDGEVNRAVADLPDHVYTALSRPCDHSQGSWISWFTNLPLFSQIAIGVTVVPIVLSLALALIFFTIVGLITGIAIVVRWVSKQFNSD